jgi:hypothetical protein
MLHTPGKCTHRSMRLYKYVYVLAYVFNYREFRLRNLVRMTSDLCVVLAITKKGMRKSIDYDVAHIHVGVRVYARTCELPIVREYIRQN